MNSEAVSAAKAALRRQVLARRDALDAATRRDWNKRITTRLLALAPLQHVRTVAAYMSIGSEFDTRAFVDYVLARGKTLLLPRVDRAARKVDLCRVTDLERELVPGVWKIPEPAPDAPVFSGESVDWVLVPGVAFTRRGERLGYGAGYYDRLIAGFAHPPVLVAAAFGMQLVDALPLAPHDRPVAEVVTEDAIYSR
jgi:5,10-methenyltetrahydrofolate synthetase